MPITHAKVSAKSDGGDTSEVLPSEWNAAHVGNSLGYFNVADYGAPGDATDQTTAIQAAITAAGAAVDANHRGGTVWLPRGCYITTATLNIPNFVRLTGPGRPMHTSEQGSYGDPSGYFGADIAAGGGLDFNMFENSDLTNGNTGIEVDHLRIDQRGVTGDHDVFHLAYLWRSSFHDNDIVGSTGTTNKRGIYFEYGEELRVVDNRFSYCGICTGNTNSLTAKNNDIGAFMKYGIELYMGFGHRIHENHIYNASEFGITGLGLKGCTLIANHVEDCDKHGMYFGELMVGNVLAMNIVKQNSRSSAGAFSGIYIDSAPGASVRNILSNNQCYDPQVSPTQQYGIYLGSYSGTQTNDNLIIGNMYYGNTAGGYAEKAGMTNTVVNNVSA